MVIKQSAAQHNGMPLRGGFDHHLDDPWWIGCPANGSVVLGGYHIYYVALSENIGIIGFIYLKIRLEYHFPKCNFVHLVGKASFSAVSSHWHMRKLGDCL